MGRLSRLLTLSRYERRVILYACLLLNGIRVALWLLPFNLVRHKLAKIASVWVCKDVPASVSLKLMVWAVNIATRYTPGGAKCLVRALTTQLLLTRYGYSHQLHIGVAKSSTDTLEAHAWVECQGRVVVGWLNNLSQFKSLSAEGLK